MQIQRVDAGACAHLWSGVSPFKMNYLIAYKHQSITGHPPLREILGISGAGVIIALPANA